ILKRQILESRNAGGDGFAFFSYSQYLDGNYKNAIKSTILSKRALSPTFNSTAALREQLKYLTERCELICKSDPNALSLDNIDVLIDCVEKVFNELKTGLSQKCITILEETKTKFQAENCDEKIKQAFLSDISKALKIAKLSKDAQKNEYYKTHPLPELYDLSELDDNEDDVSNSTDESSTASTPAESNGSTSDSSENTSPKTAIIIGIVSGIVVLAAGIVAFIIWKRKKK
ncbi:MAG: hypothetical protein RR057_00935, partial [Clostridia bacterium]